ncbi:MAG: hypothetical protein R2697_15460 [Ilumatobacteraceae bacterium]
MGRPADDDEVDVVQLPAEHLPTLSTETSAPAPMPAPIRSATVWVLPNIDS